MVIYFVFFFYILSQTQQTGQKQRGTPESRFASGKLQRCFRKDKQEIHTECRWIGRHRKWWIEWAASGRRIERETMQEGARTSIGPGDGGVAGRAAQWTAVRCAKELWWVSEIVYLQYFRMVYRIFSIKVSKISI